VVSVTIDDGAGVWIYSKVTGLKKDEKRKPASGQWIAWPPSLMENGKIVDPSQTIEGRECVVAEYTFGTNHATAWIDRQSFHIIKNVATFKDVKRVMTMTDLREIAKGYYWPFGMTMTWADRTIINVTVSSITVNTGLSDTLFDVSKLK
jgi:outer membrane lipoprotein-sorting protein